MVFSDTECFCMCSLQPRRLRANLRERKLDVSSPRAKFLWLGSSIFVCLKTQKCSDDITPEAITLICLIFLILGSLVSGLQAATAQKLNTINNIDYFTALIFFDFAIPQFFNPATGSRIQPYIKINYL